MTSFCRIKESLEILMYEIGWYLHWNYTVMGEAGCRTVLLLWTMNKKISISQFIINNLFWKLQSLATLPSVSSCTAIQRPPQWPHHLSQSCYCCSQVGLEHIPTVCCFSVPSWSLLVGRRSHLGNESTKAAAAVAAAPPCVVLLWWWLVVSGMAGMLVMGQW